MTDQDPREPSARDARPRLTLRIGVTGHRNLDGADAPALDAAIGRVLDDIEGMMLDLSHQRNAAVLYASGRPLLRLVSPLAEGADRRVAQAALARSGWKLAVPMPFARDDYETDFPESVAAFAALLKHAGSEVVALDGTRAAADDAYLAVGRFVLRHSDMMIAIWNGEVAAGVGGTAQIVQEARSAGVPVAHIDSRPPHAIRLITANPHSGPLTEAGLANLVRPLLLPDWPPGERRHLLAAETHFLHERVRTGMAPLDFLRAGPFLPPRTLMGRVFPWLNQLVGGRHEAKTRVTPMSPPAGSDDPAIRALYLHFQRTDVLATHYANLHRSTFVLIYLLGSLSLLAAFTAQFLHGILIRGFPPSLVASTVEGAALLLILALVWVDRVQRWRERWLDYRNLAEMLRQSDLLEQIGGAQLTGCLDLLDERHPARGWTPWLAAAIIRDAGMAGAQYDAVYLDRVRDYAVRARVAHQLAYHERTAARNAALSRRLRRFSAGAFTLTLLAIFAEFVWPDVWSLPWPAWFAGVLPAMAAASFGIRSQAEFEIVVHRSLRLRERLARESERLARLEPSALTSSALHQEISRCAAIMSADTTEWVAIFEVKESEVV